VAAVLTILLLVIVLILLLTGDRLKLETPRTAALAPALPGTTRAPFAARRGRSFNGQSRRQSHAAKQQEQRFSSEVVCRESLSRRGVSNP
jgi:hypothetical protein